MIAGQIIITLTDGSRLAYANKYLYKKAGINKDGTPKTDNAGTRKLYDRYGKPIMIIKDGKEVQAEEDISTPLFDGFAERSYYYTGYGDDKYDNQTNYGEIKKDFEFLKNQLGVVGNTQLRFPEDYDTESAVTSEIGGTTELLRRKTTVINGVETHSRTQIFTNEVVSITVSEAWVNFPFGRESGYNLSKSDPNFLGFNETLERKLKDFDRGPDWNKAKRFDTGFIPNPVVNISKDGKDIEVLNSGAYDTMEKKAVYRMGELVGYEVCGVVNGKKSGITYCKLSN